MIMANRNSFIHNAGLTEENSLVHLLDAISPQEENEADIIEHSKYYDDIDFNNALQSYNSKISMLSLNCESISAKFDKLKLFLDDVNNQNPISIICIQETWGHEGIQMNYFSLPNYRLINANRRLTAHGGLIIYIHNNFEFKELNEELPITQTSNSLESMFVEVWRKNYTNQKYIIGNIYRLPLYDSDNLTSFTNEYIDILNTLRNRSKFVYLCGDFNIDLLKLNSNNNYNMFFDNVISSGFVPKITLPTRICDTSSTLIDNVYTNTIDKKHTSGILIRPISDHQMYFCILNENYTKANNAHRYIEVEICNEYSIDQFRNEIANANIYDKLDLSPSANPNKNYELLAEQLQIAKSTYMPQKIKRFNKRKHKKEKWMNNELLTQIVRKNKMYVEWKTTPVTNVNYELIKLRFKSYEKDVRFAIQEAKKSYFNRIFDTYKSDIKKTWLTINDTLSRNKNKHDLPSTFHYNGLTLTNPKEIANLFNVYFAGIGDKLASEIKTSTNDDANFTSYLENPTMNRLQFRHIAEEDTMKAIDNLENKNSSGRDGISNKLLKSIRYELCKPLTLIINQMLSSGVFPETFKKSKIIPLYKKGDSSLLSNYRLISLLPTISKVFERIIYNQLSQYFNDIRIVGRTAIRLSRSTFY